MKLHDIRARMLLAALLPVALISTLLALVFLLARFDDMQQSYQQRTRLVARQLALASEYGLFSGNQVQLQLLALGALREPDLRWVAILDRTGLLQASAGDRNGSHGLAFGGQEAERSDAALDANWLAQPVFPTSIKLDELYEDAVSRSDSQPVQLGQVLVKFSSQSVGQRKRQMLLLGCLIGAVGLLFGVILAAYLSRGVIRPILRVTHLIERIGRGDFAEVRAASQLIEASDPLLDLQNNLHHMADRLASARDDLEQQIAQATQALREKKEEAEQANLAKSRFLAAASHDLRQPTHALGMFVTRLAQLPHDHQTGELIGHLEASVLAMQSLLDGLLDISRLEAGAVPVRLQPFALSSLFEQLRHDLGQAAFERSLRLRIRPSRLWLMSDATLVYRILLNLVNNALRYTDQGGVLVAARPVGGGTQVQLQVWDSGIGIAPEHQQAVFGEFYQVANPARQRSKGLGLGLNIVQRTAALLGHPLVLTSSLGRGTRFSLTLPVVAPVQTGVLAGSPLPATVVAGDLTGVAVLVIEDDSLVRTALATMLAGWGMEVFEAPGLQQALALLAAGSWPALIISDYRLAEHENGIDAVQRVQARMAQAVPACLMSGDTDPGLMQAAQVAGLTLLHKPVRPAKLRSLLRHLLLARNDLHADAP